MPKTRAKAPEIEYPRRVRAGAASVTIYRRTVAVKGREYPLFTVAYSLNGKRHSQNKSDERAAYQLAMQKAREIERGQVQTVSLSGLAMHDYLTARQALEPLKLTLAEAVRDYVEAREIVGKALLRDVAVAFRDNQAKPVIPAEVGDAVREFLAAKERDRSGRHAETLRYHCGLFLKAFDGPIHRIDARQIQDWFGRLDLEERTKFNLHGSLCNLFNWAKSRNHLPRGMETEMAFVQKPDRGGGEPGIFGSDEMQELLATIDFKLIPIAVLGAFGGLRRSEIGRLSWERVRRDFDDIEIVFVEKTKQEVRRLVPLNSQLRAWLRPHRKDTGRVCPHRDWFTQLTDQAKAAGLEWPNNVLRHSFISHQTALKEDVAGVAHVAGNTPKVVKESYLKVVRKKEAERFFAIMPPKDYGRRRRRPKAKRFCPRNMPHGAPPAPSNRTMSNGSS